jgi:hypothetical protein
MVKPCLWTLGIVFLFATATLHFFGEITPAFWTIAADVCTSNGDLAWSAMMLVAAVVFIFAKRSKSGHFPEHAAVTRAKR